ncbi:hypothetical protein Tco_0649630 [Tanacetum coccineum]
MEDGPSSLKKWKRKIFLIDRRAILDHLTWRHSHSCVSDDIRSDGYDRNDVEQIRVHLIRLREIREEMLVRSVWSSVWSNKECDLMSIYDFMTLPSWGDAKIVEEPHHLSELLLERVTSHTTAPVAEDALIPLPTPDEVAAAPPDLRLARKSKGPSQLKDSMERDVGTSIRVALVPTPRLGKKIGLPPSVVIASVSRPGHVGASAPASTFRRSLALGGSVVGGFARKSEAEAMRQYDEIPEDDFGTATRGEEIELTLFPLALGPYQMSYPYEGISSPLYTKEEWDGPHAPESNVLCKDIFKDLDVYKKSLYQIVTPAELRRTESLLPLELSNRVNILSDLLLSHGYELNSRYTDLVASRVHLQEKLDRKKGDVKLFRSEVTSLENKLEKVQRDYDALGQENKELCSQRDVASEEGYKNAADELKIEVTQFIGSGVKGLVRRLLSSDEFHASLAHVASLDINYGVERGLRMGRSDADFEEATQKVSNFHIVVEADFNEALVAFPTTLFPFLGKIVVAAGDPWIVLLVGMPISAGITTSVPYARLNGVSPLLVLGIVLWAHNTFGNSFTHAPPSWCSLVLIPYIMLRLARSTALFAWG